MNRTKTTEIYTQASKKSLAKIKSPPDVILMDKKKTNKTYKKQQISDTTSY